MKPLSLTACATIDDDSWTFDAAPVVEFQFRKAGEEEWVSEFAEVDYNDAANGWNAYYILDNLIEGDVYECRACVKAAEEGYVDSAWTTEKQATVSSKSGRK